ncbi:uncharacterized protein B0H64DRAFT_10438 [Chaetomium fimeti]|uniref:DUF7492 domain-containing protein n=1 Tax=Chaetomium fimeti TaxID=1854472 RepID=A0AAE0LWR3_9PEZI|nr:hypothetical protein B0H64DRAFT_10438 [Chaetomium fimeti]
MKLTFLDRTVAVWLLAALTGTAIAHSWPEQTVRLAPDGKEVGKPGADRAHIETGTADYLIPPNGGEKVVQQSHKIVRDTQGPLNDASYSDQFPMLSVAPGDFVAIKYRENGHVSRPDKTNPNKPVNRGTVYLYGTTENDLSSVSLMDVHLKWTSDGKGGNGKGKLLATRNYDDGQCHEVIPADGDFEGITGYRMEFVSKTDSLLCQSDLQIPADAPVGKVYTVIWVWDWPEMKEQGIAVSPAEYGAESVLVPEIYTGVVDYKIVEPCDDSLGEVKGPTCESGGGGGGGANANFATDQPATARGIASQMAEPFLVKVPQAGFDVPSATADPKNIPLGVLIGEKPTQFPLPQSILEAQNAPGGGKIPAATPAPGSGGGGGGKGENASGGDAGGDAGGDVVVTMTSTVPEGMTTMTVTRDGTAAGGAKETPAPKMRRGVHARRRGF